MVLLALVLMVGILRMPSVDLPLDTDSGANAFFARQMMRGETLYGKYHPTHHLPGVYYTYLLAFELFGDNPFAPKLLLFPFVIASGWLVFSMGCSLSDNLAGFLGAFFFVLGSSHIHLSGLTAETELFANLSLIATMLLSLILLRKDATAVQFIGVGMLGAVSFLYKVTFVAPLAIAGVSIFAVGWLERYRGGNARRVLLRLGALAIGFVLPLLFAGGYFAGAGLWPRLMLVFSYGSAYFNDTARMGMMGDLLFPRPFGFPLFMMAMNNLALLLFGSIGTYRLARRAFPLRTLDQVADFALVSWVVASFALTGLRGGGFAHYVIIVIPPLAMAAGIEISAAYNRWKDSISAKRAFVFANVATLLVVANFIWRNFDLYRYYLPYKSGRYSFEEFTRGLSFDGLSWPGRELAVAEYIEAHTTPDDRIYVWGIYMQLYYYADREPPIDFLWPSYVSATGPPQRIFEARTRYLIVDSEELYFRPQWLIDGLERQYVLETVINNYEIYRRLGP